MSKKKNSQIEPEQHLEERVSEWKEKGVERPTYGMLSEGFSSISGIPDEFYSAEDPADRVKLWNDYSRSRPRGCGCGWCSSCDPEYKD